MHTWNSLLVFPPTSFVDQLIAVSGFFHPSVFSGLSRVFLKSQYCVFGPKVFHFDPKICQDGILISIIKGYCIRSKHTEMSLDFD